MYIRRPLLARRQVLFCLVAHFTRPLFGGILKAMGQRRYQLLQHFVEGTWIIAIAAVAIAAVMLILSLSNPL
jgi:hypothetical protein